MTKLSELWSQFHLLSDQNSFSPDEKAFLERFLKEEARLRLAKKIGFLLARSGIKRVKTLGEFDWKFNPKVPRDKLMEFMAHPWLKEPCNLVMIGPAGEGRRDIFTSDASTGSSETTGAILAAGFASAGTVPGATAVIGFAGRWDLPPAFPAARSVLWCLDFPRFIINTEFPYFVCFIFMTIYRISMILIILISTYS